MIYSLTGKARLITPEMIVVECGGVGYGCKTTLNSVQDVSVGDTVTLYTYLVIREDAIDLFGFTTEEELDCFKLLTSVSGVGSKYALGILSSMTPDQTALAIASEDVKAFTKIKGVGTKIAQRIVMELKDKVTGEYSYISGSGSVSAVGAASKPGSNTQEAIQALVVLGYSQSEAASVVSKLDPELAVDELIRQGLKKLALGKFQ